MKDSRTQFVAMIGVLFCIGSIVLCAGFFFIITQKKNSFYDRSLEREQARVRLESFEKLNQTLEESQKERESLRSRILEEEDIIDFLALIESFGREQGTVLKTNNLDIKPLNTNFESLVITVNVTGPYAGVMNVLKLFEQLPYQASIGAVTFAKNDNDSWTSTYEVRVTKHKKI